MKNYYFSDYFQNCRYNDDFGHSDEWNKEIDKWLSFLYKVDNYSYNLSKKRVLIEKQRDEFLAELSAMYFISIINGCEIIEVEPKGKGNTKLDFTFIDKNREKWFVEVKRPSWRGEVVKNSSLSSESKLKRLKQPQFISGDGRSFSVNDAIEDPVRHALPKFALEQNNLLMILPNMFAQIAWMPYVHDQVMSTVRSIDQDQLLSSLLILEPSLLLGQNVTYPSKLIQLKNRPSFE